MRSRIALCLLVVLVASHASASESVVIGKFKRDGMNRLGAHSLLQELCLTVGHRIAGSDNAARAVLWGESTMKRLGFENVRLVPCMVPQWVRGPVETCEAKIEGVTVSLTCCALGTSPGTPADGVSAEVIEVKSLDEVTKLGDKVKGKIVFYNRPFDPALTNSFAQYGDAGDQRFAGPSVAAKNGAVACLVRSMTNDPDDFPHTGTTRSPGIPCAALSIVAANKLSSGLKLGPVRVTLKLSCKTLPDVESASVIGEITGSTKPNEVIVMGGHLDSWDKGQGAHDDGAGVCQSLEALRVIKNSGHRPKRTIRVVLFMNEEITGTGSQAYFEFAKASKQKHVAGIESDSGGFAPRGFSTSNKRAEQLASWQKQLAPFEIEKFSPGGGGADVEALGTLGAILYGLEPESQRYFDYHHSDKDTIDKVHPRELELGALAMAGLAWLISED